MLLCNFWALPKGKRRFLFLKFFNDADAQTIGGDQAGMIFSNPFAVAVRCSMRLTARVHAALQRAGSVLTDGSLKSSRMQRRSPSGQSGQTAVEDLM